MQQSPLNNVVQSTTLSYPTMRYLRAAEVPSSTVLTVGKEA